MGVRFNKSGCIFNCYVKDKVLHIKFKDDLEITTPCNFVSEDFMISHTWPVSNVCLLCEAENGDLLIAWFSGGMAVYRPNGIKYRLIARTGFDINSLIADKMEVITNGCIKKEYKTLITRTLLYPIHTYFIKGNNNYVVLDLFDLVSALVVDVRKNPEIVQKFAFGGKDYPGFLRVENTIVEFATRYVVQDPHVIKQAGSDTYSIIL